MNINYRKFGRVALWTAFVSLVLLMIRENTDSWISFLRICTFLLFLCALIAGIVVHLKRKNLHAQELQLLLMREKVSDWESMKAGSCPKCKSLNVTALPRYCGTREYQNEYQCSDCHFKVFMYEEPYRCPKCHETVERSATSGGYMVVDAEGSPYTDLDHSTGSRYFPGQSSAICRACGWERSLEDDS